MSRPAHVLSGRWKFGFVLAIITALSFGLLPVALKGLIGIIDVYTLTWYRFVLAAGILAAFIIKPGKLKAGNMPGWRIINMMLIAGILMSINYILYVIGLQFVSPSTAQVVIQLAPIFLLLASLIVFKEHFTRIQWMGLGAVIIGQGLFFNQRLMEMMGRMSDYTFGVVLIVLAAFTWSIYGIIQKKLLRDFSSTSIILFLYVIGSLIFLPMSDPSVILHLNGMQLFLLAFCGLNSLISYGAFAESLNHLEASRVSAILAMVPIITVISVEICTMVMPDFIQPENLSALSIGGAVLVVVGSMVSALGKA